MPTRRNRLPVHHHRGDGISILVRLRRLNDTQCEGILLPLPAAAMLTHRQPCISDAAAELLLAQARQHKITSTFLTISATSAGFEILTEVINGQDETSDGLRHGLQDIHDGLPDGI